jgi:excisionase family DNA binding protein
MQKALKKKEVIGFEKFFYSRNEAANSLAVSVRAIDYLISDGKLRTRRKGRRVLISSEDVRRVAAEIMQSDMVTPPGKKK